MNILVPIADGSEEIEFTTIVNVLRRGEINVITSSLMAQKEVTASRKVKLVADTLFAEINTDEFDMIVLPGGGPGSAFMKQHKPLLETLRAFNESGKMIGAICAAPTVLESIGLLKGKKATCYPSLSENLISAEYSTERVVVDGNIITSQGPGTTFDFALKIIELVISEEISNKIRKELLL